MKRVSFLIVWLFLGFLPLWQVAAKDFSYEEIKGAGIAVGNPDAERKLIAFVDSRCPHCHRLMAYAQDLIKAGKIYIEFRQVAYLEEAGEAVLDTRLMDSRLVNKKGLLADKDYLVLLSGGGNVAQKPIKSIPAYQRAVKLIKNNSRTAKKLLRIRLVPGLMVLDEKTKRYHLAGYWEMNRIMQPSLDKKR